MAAEAAVAGRGETWPVCLYMVPWEGSVTAGLHSPLPRCWRSYDRQLSSLESSTSRNIIGGRCGQVGPEQDRKIGINATWSLQLNNLFAWPFEAPFGGIPETTEVQTKERQLKSFSLDRCYQPIPWVILTVQHLCSF